MPKAVCYACNLKKNTKFFPKEQPYEDHKICDKCLGKCKKRNDMIAQKVQKAAGYPLSPEDKRPLRLSYRTVSEMETKAKENKDLTQVFTGFTGCQDAEHIRETLSIYDFSETALNEMTAHFAFAGRLTTALNKLQVQEEEDFVVPEEVQKEVKEILRRARFERRRVLKEAREKAKEAKEEEASSTGSKTPDMSAEGDEHPPDLVPVMRGSPPKNRGVLV